MPRIIFVTSVTEDYLPQASRLLETLSLLKACEKVVMTVGFNMPATDHYRTAFIPHDGTICNQQGQMLDVLPDVGDDDIIVMADADACIQRDLSGDEIYFLQNLSSTEVGLGPNQFPGQTAETEWAHLKPRAMKDSIERTLGVQMADVPVFNGGFIAARVGVWKKIRPQFVKLWPLAPSLFEMWRCCQLLLCVTIKKLRLTVKVVPYSMHSHQHYPLTHLHSVIEGVLHHGNRVVFYAHHVEGMWHTREHWLNKTE